MAKEHTCGYMQYVSLSYVQYTSQFGSSNQIYLYTIKQLSLSSTPSPLLHLVYLISSTPSPLPRLLYLLSLPVVPSFCSTLPLYVHSDFLVIVFPCPSLLYYEFVQTQRYCLEATGSEINKQLRKIECALLTSA